MYIPLDRNRPVYLLSFPFLTHIAQQCVTLFYNKHRSILSMTNLIVSTDTRTLEASFSCWCHGSLRNNLYVSPRRKLSSSGESSDCVITCRDLERALKPSKVWGGIFIPDRSCSMPTAPEEHVYSTETWDLAGFWRRYPRLPCNYENKNWTTYLEKSWNAFIYKTGRLSFHHNHILAILVNFWVQAQYGNKGKVCNQDVTFCQH